MELDHVVLEVSDPRRSLAFYKDVLGLRPVRAAEFEAGKAPFPSARIAPGTVIDFFPRRMWNGRLKTNPNHFCLALPRRQYAALLKRLRVAGIPIERESARNFGARGYAHSVYFRDPDCVTIEARCYSAPSRR